MWTHCFLCAAQVLLLDEVTVDLDVVARMDLLQFFVQECNQVRPRCLQLLQLSALYKANLIPRLQPSKADVVGEAPDLEP